MAATLPGVIGQLRELRQLDLRGNPLTHLPAAIAGYLGCTNSTFGGLRA